MYKGLSLYAIGVKPANLDGAIAAAKIGGFDGLEFSAAEVANLIDSEGVSAVRGRFDSSGIVPAGWGLQIDWRGTEDAWKQGLETLPRLAGAASSIGGTRTMTWIMPCSNELNFDSNWQFHVERFTPVAAILASEGCALGLEFIGPKTLRDSRRYPFIYTPQAMLAMGREIGPNVGLLLDCWHWHTSGGTVADLEELTPEQVVYVHVNDAPAGVALDDHVDNVRGLPGETGVIDIAGFLGALKRIGYEGPVVPEPFKDLSGLASDEERLKLVGGAMDRIFEHVRRN